MHVALLTDIPVWVRPLANALEKVGATVSIVEERGWEEGADVVVNRLSTAVIRRAPEYANELFEFLLKNEKVGSRVINGSLCLEIGWSKFRQHQLFESMEVRTPRTALIENGERSFPEIPVLLKPPAGGFGKGIEELGVGDPIRPELVGKGWIEQEKIVAVDNAVHRVELLGDRILYEAVSPLDEGNFNYCLAKATDETSVLQEEQVSVRVKEPILRIAREMGMEIGAIEYMLNQEERPVFIDINPVSSLHPDSKKVLGSEPLDLVARYIVERKVEAQPC
ncbi:MAG: hypothetical protein AAGJ81_04375 [Verrucomicrobiota bacterium]